jgi:hypothetical protein
MWRKDGATVVWFARSAFSGNDHVGHLLGDLGHPLHVLAADLGVPMQVSVVSLSDRLDALHEVGEVLELRGLLVVGAARRVDDNRLGDGLHGACLLKNTGGGKTSTAGVGRLSDASASGRQPATGT